MYIHVNMTFLEKNTLLNNLLHAICPQGGHISFIN